MKNKNQTMKQTKKPNQSQKPSIDDILKRLADQRGSGLETGTLLTPEAAAAYNFRTDSDRGH